MEKRPRRLRAGAVSYREVEDDEFEQPAGQQERKRPRPLAPAAALPPPAAASARRPPSATERQPRATESSERANKPQSGEDQAMREVRQQAAGMEGSYYSAHVLSDSRGDGLVEVQYKMLHQSALFESPLKEWIQPTDSDELRPIPPGIAGGFHEALLPGTEIEASARPGWIE